MVGSHLRAILTRIPVGDDPLTCGPCPFLEPDYRSSRHGWACAHPLLSGGEAVTEVLERRRTVACLAAEAEAEAGIR